MLEVRPVVDEHEKEALSARCHFRYRRDTLMYAVFEKEIPLSVSFFQCKDQIARFYAVAPTDETNREPLNTLRLAFLGALTFALQGGCERFYFSKSFPKELPESLGLRCTNEGFYNFW